MDRAAAAAAAPLVVQEDPEVTTTTASEQTPTIIGNQRPMQPQPTQPRYGADGLTRRQFALVQLGISLGTCIEWYEYSVYGALAAVITPLFFPPTADGTAASSSSSSSSSQTQALYFWGIFALSFITRPIGSLLLGSIGDRWGRRPALLLSLVGMAVPTVLIGCLPTYAMIGVAAPIVLAVLRAIQGLAMGGEFAIAMIYGVELAPDGRKGRYGALQFLTAIAGIALGNATVMVLSAALSAEQMGVWGWRLPFVAMAFSALGAFILRLRLPEPRAWEEAACCEVEQRAGGGGGGGGGGDSNDKAAGLPVSDTAAAAAPAPASASSVRRRRASRPRPSSGGRRRHTPGIPALKILRRSWPQVALQTAFEAFPSVAFYLFALWLPQSHRQARIMDLETAGGVTLAALAFMAAASFAGGWASDACATPRRRLAPCALAIAVGTAAVVPGFVGVASRAPVGGGGAAAAGALAAPGVQAAAAIFQVGMLALAGFVLGAVPSLCAELYAPDVRVVSFSLAHNLSMSLLGGTAPLVIQAMRETGAGKAGAAPGVYTAAAGGASLLGAAILAAWAGRWFVAAPAPAPAPVAAEGDGGGRAAEARPPPPSSPPIAAAYV
jgi:MFS family permease